ncbi:hypothetical protein [Archangium sp.]|uniref:hypothetical protein n=1 Tax=Archangium sp. TaxID=1872627 RepID=UPI00286C2FCA|nr:hypothetical protein [Archangium sp.]
MRLSLRLVVMLLLPLALARCDKPKPPPVPPAPLPEQYTLGGSVTGLEGGGLVLANADETLAIPANGAFTFTRKALAGTAYDVKVRTQPSDPTQECTVARGAGTQGEANVADIAVTCTTRSFKVGGTVTGLATGRTVRLQNNGGDMLTVSANGTFQFATAVKSGLAFAVTVSTQPTQPWQTCAVAGGTGMVGGADVSSITVNCATNSYTLGGTISGLNGTVVLKNGTQEVTVTSNGTFAFPQTLLSGTAYDVQVKTPPAIQDCTVTRGTGSVGSGNVSNVLVTCVTHAYQVKVDVRGLVGTVVLRNNGGDDLTVTASGLSAFTTKVTQGTPYFVTLAQQPATQTCTVDQSAALVMGGADVTVAVTCVTNTYTLGGTVSGLDEGDSLELANGGDTFTVTANGGFTFSGKVGHGSDYEVVVKTAPARKACSVDNGKATMGGANVTNVSVSCSFITYAVGGTLGNLGEGGTLKVLNNGGDELTLDKNGPFTFATRVVQGDSYAVTLSAQPVGQRCTVANGSGANLMGDITDVAITCVPLYTVGGSVTGLGSGKTLVLTNNGGDALTLGENGAFTFSTPVLEGGSYAVAISAQPESQRCTVANGSGSDLRAHVTDVAITCVSLYTVGGSITGLESGKTLALTNNGGDELTLSENASFTFTTPVEEGGSYAVAISSAQPEGQRCTVANGSGTDLGANVTDVTVTCVFLYTLGGSVTGLESGKTLVLTNNGGNDLTVEGTADGNVSFTFSTPLAPGETYAVALKTQPEGLLCTVDGTTASGTITTAHVTNVAVTCKLPPPPLKVSVLRVGTGTGALGPAATAVFIDTYDLRTNTLLGTTPATGLTLSGSAISEGLMTRSSDGRYLVFAGYKANPGTTGVNSATASAINRGVGRLDGSGTFIVAATLTNAFNGSNVRSATTADGSMYWVAGFASNSTGGIHHVVHNSLGESTQILGTPYNNARGVVASSGQLYLSTGSGTNKPIFAVGTGLPTTSGQTATGLNGLPSFGSAYGFVFLDRDPSVEGDDTLYVADDGTTGGVFKFVKDASGTWASKLLTNPGKVRGVAAIVDGDTVQLVATTTETTANRLVTFLDDGTDTATWTTVATAPANTAFRGVALAPIP